MSRWLHLMIFCLLLGACGTPLPLPTLAPSPTAEATAANTAEPLTATPAPSQPAFIRIVHAAPQTDRVNMTLGETAVVSFLSFGVGTSKTQIDAGDYTLRVRASAAPSDSAPLYESHFSISPNASLIVVFTGTADALTVVTYPETSEALRVGEARVSAIHAVPRGIDFTLRQADADLTTPVGFGQRSASVVLPAGQTTLAFQAGDRALLSYPINLRASYSYTLVLVGSSNDPNSLEVIAFENQVPTLTSVRPLHMAFDVPAVDFYLDGELLGSAIDYARAGDRVETNDGLRMASVYAAGADITTTEPLFSETINLQSNAALALILLGTSSELRFFAFVEDLSPTPEGKLRLGLINTVPSVSVARVIDVNNSYGDVYYGQQAQHILLGAGTYTLFWNDITEVASGVTVEEARDLQFEAGRYYLYFMTGRDPSNPPVIFSENVGIQTVITETPMTQMRFVNAIPDGSTVDFLLNGVVVASGVAYGQSSVVVDVPADRQILSVRQTGALGDLSTLDIRFEASTTYTIVASGDTGQRVQLRGFADTFARETGAASVRLLNLSDSTLVQLGIAYSISTVALVPTPIPTEVVFDEQTTFRYTLPGSAVVALQGVTNRSVFEGFVDTIAVPSGVRDVYVVDSATQNLAAYLGTLLLEANTHYDIVAFQASNSQFVRAFVLAYSLP